MVEIPVMLIAVLSLTTSFIGTHQQQNNQHLVSATASNTPAAHPVTNKDESALSPSNRAVEIAPAILQLHSASPKKYFFGNESCPTPYTPRKDRTPKKQTFGQLLRALHAKRNYHYAPYR